jgi:transcriptional regulator with XRE-family HTH domain
MQMDEWAIGQRIAAHRVRRSLTQEELAGLVGISLSMMKKIESGDRSVTRFSQLVRFAEALRITDLRELTGVSLALLPNGRRQHAAATEVCTALMARGHDSDAPIDLDRLAKDSERVWQTWQAASAFRYAAVGQALPDLLLRAQHAVGALIGAERRRALRLASMVCQLARTWTKRVGEHELSLLAADRAVTYALDADDPDYAGAAAWNLAMILSAQGQLDQARTVAERAIADLRKRLSESSRQRLAVFGGLHLVGAAVAARDDRATDARRLIDAADAVARKTGETNHFRLVFGPTNVQLHRVSTATELGRTTEALSLAERTVAADAAAVERRLTFHLDAARCYARTGNDVAAVHMVHRVHQESPEELQYSSGLRETVRLLIRRAKPAIQAELQPLLTVAGLPD